MRQKDEVLELFRDLFTCFENNLYYNIIEIARQIYYNIANQIKCLVAMEIMRYQGRLCFRKAINILGK